MGKAKRDEVPGLGAKLKEAREANGMTQVQAAEVSGIQQTHLSKFERGVKTPTLATLITLAKAYGVEIGDLVPKDVVEPTPESPPAPKKGKK